MSQVKGQGHILYLVSNRCTSFLFHINQTNHSWDMARMAFGLGAKITVSNRTFPKSNQVIMMTRAIKLQVLYWSDEWFLLYRADKQIFANPWAKSWKGHPVHFARPIYSLPQDVAQTILTWETKVFCGSGRGWNELKTKSHPRPGWLNEMIQHLKVS